MLSHLGRSSRNCCVADSQQQTIADDNKKIAMNFLALTIGGGVFVTHQIITNTVAEIDIHSRESIVSLFTIATLGCVTGLITDSIYSQYPLKQRIGLNFLSVSGLINIVQNVVTAGCLLNLSNTSQLVCQATKAPYVAIGAVSALGLSLKCWWNQQRNEGQN